VDFASFYYKGKKIINNLGLGYQKIDDCFNECIVYWDKLSEKDIYHVCGVSRWKTVTSKEAQTSKENLNAKA